MVGPLIPTCAPVDNRLQQYQCMPWDMWPLYIQARMQALSAELEAARARHREEAGQVIFILKFAIYIFAAIRFYYITLKTIPDKIM